MATTSSSLPSATMGKNPDATSDIPFEQGGWIGRGSQSRHTAELVETLTPLVRMTERQIESLRGVFGTPGNTEWDSALMDGQIFRHKRFALLPKNRDTRLKTYLSDGHMTASVASSSRSAIPKFTVLVADAKGIVRELKVKSGADIDKAVDAGYILASRAQAHDYIGTQSALLTEDRFVSTKAYYDLAREVNLANPVEPSRPALSAAG